MDLTDMTDRATGKAPDHGRRPSPWRRLAWFVGIWAGTAAAAILFAYAIRALIGL